VERLCWWSVLSQYPLSELQGKQVGSFQDAAVEGLTYWTASNGLGQTGENGSFNFEPGEVVALYIGNELVTLTDAELYSTPMDTLSVRSITVANAGHPHQALNVLRLLQTVDDSADESTITIPDSFHADRNGNVVGLNFAQDTVDFASSAGGSRHHSYCCWPARCGPGRSQCGCGSP
jgi:hypothetical protein